MICTRILERDVRGSLDEVKEDNWTRCTMIIGRGSLDEVYEDRWTICTMIIGRGVRGSFDDVYEDP